MFIIAQYYEVNLGKSWVKIESDLIYKNKLKCQSDPIFSNRESILTFYLYLTEMILSTFLLWPNIVIKVN